jgi:phage gpG-like protein
MEAQIRTDGLRDLRRDFKRVDRDIDRGLVGDLRDEVAKVAAEASMLAPRRTGALAGSYRPFVTMRAAGIRSRLPYAGVHEYGGTISPRGADIVIRRSEPVTRAVARQEDAIVDGFGDAVEKAARRAGWH